MRIFKQKQSAPIVISIFFPKARGSTLPKPLILLPATLNCFSCQLKGPALQGETIFNFFLVFYGRIVDLQYYIQFHVYSILIQYFYRSYSIKSYYKIMAIIPCAIQYILVAYLFYTQQFVSVNPIPLICPSPLW